MLNVVGRHMHGFGMHWHLSCTYHRTNQGTVPLKLTPEGNVLRVSLTLRNFSSSAQLLINGGH
jgi:hypothetical protein